MMTNEQRPDRLEPIQGEISFDGQDKDNINLSKRQRKVYELLRTGKHSVTSATIALGYCDFRSYVRYLIEKGVPVKSEWVEKSDTRYKLYWI